MYTVKWLQELLSNANNSIWWPSRLGLQNTPTVTQQRMRLPQRVSCYDTKQSDGKVPVMLEVWGMRSNPLLPSLPGPLWPGVIAPDRVLSMCQIEINSVLMPNRIVKNRTVYMHKMDLALDNLRSLIYHWTKPSLTKQILFDANHLFAHS